MKDNMDKNMDMEFDFDFDDEEYNLSDVVQEDCMTFNQMYNDDALLMKFLYVERAEESSMYNLIWDDDQLWFGTLEEINAAIKVMIQVFRLEHSETI